MSTVRRAAHNWGALFIAQIVARLSGLFITALLARKLGGANFGSYSLAVSFASLFAVIAGLGIRQILVRDIIHNPENARRFIGNAVVSHFFQAIATIIAAYATARILGYQGSQLYGIVIMSLTMVFMAYESLFYAVFEARERIGIEAVHLLLRQGVWIALAVVALLTDQGYLVFLAMLLCTAAFIAMTSGVVVWKSFYRFTFAIHGPTLKHLLRRGLPLAGAAVLVDIYLKIDMVMLDQMLTIREVGHYGASYRIIQSLLFVSGSFFTVVYPIFSRLQRDEPGKLSQAYVRSLKVISLALVPVAAGISALSIPLMGRIYGGEFVRGASALAIAVWAVPVFGLAVVMGRVLLSLNKQRVILYVSVFSVMANIGLNLLLIPHMEIRGAALASLITIVAVALLNYIAVGRLLHRPPLWPMLWRIYAAGAGMGAVVLWLLTRLDWLVIPVGVLVYGILILILGALDKEDRMLIRRLWQRADP